MPQTLSNIMAQNFTTVGVDDTVEDVECILGSHKYSCVPVVYPEGQCFGIVSSIDLLEAYITANLS